MCLQQKKCARGHYVSILLTRSATLKLHVAVSSMLLRMVEDGSIIRFSLSCEDSILLSARRS